MRYHGRLPDLARDLIERSRQSPATTLFVMPSRGVAERVTEILREYEVNARLTSVDDKAEASAAFDALVTVGKLSGGFELRELPAGGERAYRTCWCTSKAICSTRRRSQARASLHGNQAREEAARARRGLLSDFRDLKVNDFVVHIDHGIARFGGLVIALMSGQVSHTKS